MAGRGGLSFGSQRFVVEDAVLHTALLRADKLSVQTQRQYNHMLFRGPNWYLREIFGNASGRPEESAPLLSRDHNPARAHERQQRPSSDPRRVAHSFPLSLTRNTLGMSTRNTLGMSFFAIKYSYWSKP
jgi:hypothetical protein